MTHAELHDIPKFAELFVDPRFVALLNYMRENIDRPKINGTTAEALIHGGGHQTGWLDSINAIPRLAKAPPVPAGSRQQDLYSERPR